MESDKPTVKLRDEGLSWTPIVKTPLYAEYLAKPDELSQFAELMRLATDYQRTFSIESKEGNHIKSFIGHVTGYGALNPDGYHPVQLTIDHFLNPEPEPEATDLRKIGLDFTKPVKWMRGDSWLVGKAAIVRIYNGKDFIEVPFFHDDQVLIRHAHSGELEMVSLEDLSNYTIPNEFKDP